MRKGGGKSKGSAFERAIAKRLSLWWTDLERDDVFWLTSGSGARAKTRSKQNQSTFGSYGDLHAIDPIGQKLFDKCCLELKVGYGKWSVLDVLDKPTAVVKQTFEEFLDQNYQDCCNAKVRWPVLIFKRDRRVPMIVLPRDMFSEIEQMYGKTNDLHDHLIFRRRVNEDKEYEDFIILKLETFLDWCDPAFFSA
jgi:hypothetical protein